jgi:exodeoxyribonuclease-3
LIQETHISCLQEVNEIDREWKGRTYWSFGSSRSCGVGILFKPNLSHSVSSFYHDYEGRVILVNCQYNNLKYRLMNIYAPNKERARREFLWSLRRHLGGRIPLFLGGDFNFIENPSLDKTGGNFKIVSQNKL